MSSNCCVTAARSLSLVLAGGAWAYWRHGDGEAPVGYVTATLERAAGRPIGLTFVPHLTPMIRGIHATLYVRLTGTADLQSLYERRYAGEPFVDVMPAGSHPDTRSTRGANFCRRMFSDRIWGYST